MTDNYSLSRNERVAKVSHESWDLVIVGGGITGAGILKLASQLGLKALLLEKNDFSWGSSSRSSKMVHGGLRYIADGQIKLTVESVKERQHLVAHSNGLVFNQSFLMSHYKNVFPHPWLFNGLLSVYDYIAGIKQHKFIPKDDFGYFVPKSNMHNCIGGSQFTDAITDDCRLVLRLIQEAQTNNTNALAINYANVKNLSFKNKVKNSLVVEFEGLNKSINVNTKLVVNATGAQANQFCLSKPHVKLRALRGSHLVVPSWSLPVASAISVRHPKDKRPVQIYPWQNTTIIGTTDVEHKGNLNFEPKISQSEFNYLLECIQCQFNQKSLEDIELISTFAGIRPVVSQSQGNKLDPSNCLGVLVRNHAPFCWGRNTQEAFNNSEILEYIAELACISITINSKSKISKNLINKHFNRKHGTKSYYGQK